jgi:hypothetical protein
MTLRGMYEHIDDKWILRETSVFGECIICVSVQAHTFSEKVEPNSFCQDG